MVVKGVKKLVFKTQTLSNNLFLDHTDIKQVN